MPTVKQVIFKQAVRGAVQKDQDLKVESVELDLAAPANGVTLKTLHVSLDPYMKGRMRAPETKSYNTTFEIDKPISGSGLAEVVESNDPNFPKGTIVSGMMSHSEYYHVEDMKKAGLNKLQNPHNLPVEKFLGVLGMPGLTAYASLYDIGAPKSGETIFVSAASGAVGSLVGQLAKREGLRVIGSAGSDEKVAYLKETLKFDEAFNYKTEEPAAALSRLAPDGIDIYYDNVGGPTLDAAINAMKTNGRIVACGAISQYNNSSAEEAYGVKNMVQFVSKRLMMKGFIISDMWAKWYPEFIQKVGTWVAEGEISYKEDVYQGIDSEIDAFIGMLIGKNFGKVVVSY